MSYEGSPVKINTVAILEQHLMPAEIEDKPQDECGVLAIYGPDNLAIGEIAWNTGVRQEHRGHSGSGMAFIDPINNATVLAKGHGKLKDAIPEMAPLGGTTPADRVDAIKIMVHNRYSTDPSNRVEATQPFIEDESTEDELTLAQNGHLDKHSEKGINALAVKYGVDPASAESDTQILAKVMSVALRDAKYGAGGVLSTAKLGSVMSRVLAQVNGAYCLTMFYDSKVIGARDPWGVHLLSLGTFPGGKRGAFASETVALNKIEEATPFESKRDVKPGELIIIDDEGIKNYRIPRRVLGTQFCKFEYIYTADEESEANGAHVRTVRYNLGKHLAEAAPVNADIVIAVPSTGIPYAEGYSDVSGIPKVDAITKRKNATRSFHERADVRAETLKTKFFLGVEVLEGRSVVVVDDSTIKGNTARQLIQQLRDAGAREVHFRFASEPYISACNRGMDTSNIDELIARGHTNAEMAVLLGADSVAFSTHEALVNSIDAASDDMVESVVGKLCVACTKGDYSDGIVPEQVLEERRRIEAAEHASRLVTV